MDEPFRASAARGFSAPAWPLSKQKRPRSRSSGAGSPNLGSVQQPFRISRAKCVIARNKLLQTVANVRRTRTVASLPTTEIRIRCRPVKGVVTRRQPSRRARTAVLSFAVRNLPWEPARSAERAGTTKSDTEGGGPSLAGYWTTGWRASSRTVPGSPAAASRTAPCTGRHGVEPSRYPSLTSFSSCSRAATLCQSRAVRQGTSESALVHVHGLTPGARQRDGRVGGANLVYYAPRRKSPAAPGYSQSEIMQWIWLKPR